MVNPEPTAAPEFPRQFQRALHLAALVQIAVAWPLYDLLSRFPEFFVARQSRPADIAMLVLVLGIAVPAVLFGLQAFLSRIDQRLGRSLYLLLIAALFLLLGLSLSHGWLDHPAQLAFAVTFGLLLTLAYWRTRVGALFATFLAPAIVVVPAVFLLNLDVSSLLRPAESESWVADPNGVPATPVIFVVFDELPTWALLDASGDIDAERFPNLKALADASYWFPNATTVATSTALAIPPIVTGRYPAAFVMPHHGEHPDNLFTWLGSDYDLNVQEAVSALCPRSLCDASRLPTLAQRVQRLLLDGSAIYLNLVAADLLAGKLPVITQSWEAFWDSAGPGKQMYEHRLLQLAEFVERIQATRKPGLEFIHVNFPHIPYEYLPSGKRYADGWLMPGLDFAADVWTGTPAQTDRALHRFLLQLGALDAWLGTLLDRLQDLGLYDRSVIVLTADHGVSFTAGASRRDTPPLENLERSILPVPLIIKAPHQSMGVVSRRNAETIDIIPTLAELLDRPVTWPVDGVSLMGEPKPSGKRAVHNYRDLAAFETDVSRIEEARVASAREAVLRTSGQFGGQPLSGAVAELLGKSVANLAVRTDGDRVAHLRDPAHFSSVDLQSHFLPAHATGVIESPDHSPTRLAIALNGVIVALTDSYADNDACKFSAMLPEAAFRQGVNALQVFTFEPADGGELVLTSIGPDSGQTTDVWRPAGDTVTLNGDPMAVDLEGIQGQLDYLSFGEASVEVFGWVIDAAQRRTVSSVLVFAGDRLVYRGETTMLREETHRFDTILKVGFHAVIPQGALPERSRAGLRVFAVTEDGRARELRKIP